MKSKDGEDIHCLDGDSLSSGSGISVDSNNVTPLPCVTSTTYFDPFQNYHISSFFRKKNNVGYFSSISFLLCYNKRSKVSSIDCNIKYTTFNNMQSRQIIGFIKNNIKNIFFSTKDLINDGEFFNLINSNHIKPCNTYAFLIKKS